ncbi:MAG: hypothetical protein IJ821_00150 [Lachnospiraceae bacterium]|nr:hypothetical protein [Lachnospiraceae bacterium]
MPAVNTNDWLSMTQVKADLMLAKYSIDQSEKVSAKMSKSIKGQCGYHLQQACEKMIKIQIYTSGKKIDNARIYKHSLKDLLVYAKSLGLSIKIPSYVEKNKDIITRWEATGRYDLHMVVRIDTLKKCYTEADRWYADLVNDGYK